MAPTYRLGKKPKIVDARTLQLHRYLTAELPAAPVSVAWQAAVPQNGWPMMGNDQYGDCTCAAAGHLIECWTANAQGAANVLPDTVILGFYNLVDGGVDQGAALLTVLNDWRTDGIAGDKITSYAEVNPQDPVEVENAVHLFGGIYIGLALPDAVVQGDLASADWTKVYGAPDENNGHCVPILGYDVDHLYCITWGAVKPMSWAFFRAYCDEAYGILTVDWFGKGGEAPVGLDLAQLTADLQNIAHPPDALTDPRADSGARPLAGTRPGAPGAVPRARADPGARSEPLRLPPEHPGGPGEAAGGRPERPRGPRDGHRLPDRRLEPGRPRALRPHRGRPHPGAPPGARAPIPADGLNRGRGGAASWPPDDGRIPGTPGGRRGVYGGGAFDQLILVSAPQRFAFVGSACVIRAERSIG